MPVEVAPRANGWCMIRPTAAGAMADLGLHTAADFLALPGVVVGGHVQRNVSRVDLGERVGYLKREHSVRWRDRFRNFLAGFGPVSMSLREAAILWHLDASESVGPSWLACGEVNGQAFLLLEDAADAIDLRRLTNVGPGLAQTLGAVIAALHAAGIDQPDLFAKHFLIAPGTERVTILDWQRAVRTKVVPRRRRIAALGTLRATCPRATLPQTAWRILLGAYCRTSGEPDARDFFRKVHAAEARSANRPALRGQLAVPTVDQELVRIDGETVCAVPRIAGEIDQPDAIASLYDLANDGRPIRFHDGSTGRLRVRHYLSPLGRWFQKLRGKSWRAPELRIARLLLHLERHGIPAPKLLAYGQTVPGVTAARAFVLAEVPDADPVSPADAWLVRGLLDRLHAAGCLFASAGPPAQVFGMLGGQAVIVEPSGLRLLRNPSQRQRARDAVRLAAFFRTVS